MPKDFLYIFNAKTTSKLDTDLKLASLLRSEPTFSSFYCLVVNRPQRHNGIRQLVSDFQ